MKNIYYLIWVDFITSAKRHHPERADWKFSLYVLVTMCNALNIYAVYIWFMYFFKMSYLIRLNIFPGTILNDAFSFLIQFAAPFILINYLLIFYKDKYKKLLKKYPSKNGRLALIYSLCSIWIGFISIILYSLLK
jgi:hypothetical protein